MRERKRRGGIFLHVSILFFVSILTTGLFTFITEKQLSDRSVKRGIERLAKQIAEEVRRSVTEYPAYEWFLCYWYEHPDSLDIEYDAEFSADSITAEKSALFSSRHPDLQLRYAESSQLEALPEEDRKLCAEIVYSWLNSRFDQIKQTYRIDYLFCLATEAPYESQFFLFSGADEDSVRGTDYEQVYPLGHTVTVTESQQDAMRSALASSSHLAHAGNYMDYYSFLCSAGGTQILIGMTYDLSGLRTSIRTQTLVGTNFAMINQLVLSLLCLLLVYIFVLKPLKKVSNNIDIYRKEKDSATVTRNLSKIRSDNEIGQLADDFSDLATEIDAYLDEIKHITSERERIRAELSLATRIQAAMLPHVFPAFPDRKEFDIYASMVPAKEVGGDFYDFYMIDDDHLCLTIADVSGKGVPGALFMMVSKITLQSNGMLSLHPAEILSKANDSICANNQEQMFVTVWLGILESSTGIITASNAGHEYPALMKDGRFSLMKDKHGFVIGGMEGIRYPEYSFTLEPGDKLFLYTDGVPEATDARNRMFGTGNMLVALNRDPEADPQKLLANVRKGVNTFVKDAEQFDDLTMLCLSYKGPS